MPHALRFSACLLLLLPGVASSLHLVQIEQVMVGVDGDPQAQAVQLRFRADDQGYLTGVKLVAYDAAGQNPVVLVQLGVETLAGALTGDRVLFATPQFVTTPDVPPDFVLSAPIPEAYLAAGRLAYVDTFLVDIVRFSLCWGGSAYTGPTTGATTNDADGNFGPCFAGPLPANGGQALYFDGAATQMHTTNADDYALTTEPPVFENFPGETGIVVPWIFVDGFDSP